MREDAFACNDAADNLSAIVGALVAHHAVIRDAMLVGACEVAVETAFELARTEGAIMLARRFAGKNIVELRAIGAANGMDVIRSFHTAFELEGAGPRAEELGYQIDGAIVARAEGALTSGGGNNLSRGVEDLIGETARLGAHPAVGGSSGAGKARKLTEPGVTKADGAVAKNLKIDIDA